MLCVLIVFTSCNKQNQANQIIDDNKDTNTISFDGSYEFVALKTDNQGIELSSAFQLSSKEDIDNNFIKNNLQIIPKIDYKIKKLSNTSYNIIPASSLENNKVYQVKLDSPKGLYSWAFQTKKQFNVDSTIPSNDSNYVPESSGIEMYFNMTNLDSIDKYFSIYPQVEGEFIYKNNSVIFVPKNPLTQGKRYTVTIKKGFGVKNSEEKLLDDFVFTFTVEKTFEQAFVGDDLVNIFKDNTKVFKGYFGKNYKEKEFTIDIYKFKNADAFSNSYLEYLKAYEFNQNLEDSSVLTKVNTIYQQPYIFDSSYHNEGLFELPKEIAKGHYLINISLKDNKDFNSYQFLQINDMMMYNAIFNDKILVYAIDGKNSEGISGTEVYLNDKKLGTTKDDGVILENIDIEKLKGSLNIVKLKAKGYNDFIYAEKLFYYEYYHYNTERYKYFSYTYTDRDVYLPTDTINLWGYARFKDDTRVDELKLELIEPDTDMVIETKYVRPNDIGTYQAKFSLNNWTNSYCGIRIYHNNTLIGDEYLDVKEYTKPLYYIESEFDKDFVYSDEALKLKISAKFFDGYPVKGIGINYGTQSYGIDNQYHRSTKLDDKGESIVDIDTSVKSTDWRPKNITIYSTNEEAEETIVRNYNTFTVFPKHQMLEINHGRNNNEYFSVLLHELDNSLYGSDKYKNTNDLRGEVLNGSVKLEIHESYYEKYVFGERYDFINKQKVVDYRYKRIENKVYDEIIAINNGSSDIIKIPNLNEERYYEIIASYDDGKGGIIEKIYVGMSYVPYDSDKNYYTLDQIDDDKLFRLNEEIELSLNQNGSIAENVDDDKLLVLTMNNGLINYKFYDETTFKDVFKEEYVPNVILNGVYIKNGYIYPVEYNKYLYYDYKERQIYFDVVTDKEEYRPGDNVILKVKAYDENKNPIVADLNISVVDEAYFSIFPQNVDILDDFYDYVYYTGIISTYLSNEEIKLRNDVEKGGGGDGFEGTIRDDFKDTNIFETVRTDKDGNAELKFKLADNITSWRITYQAISEEKYVGNGKKNITSTLPFYVDMIMYDKYLIDDNIGVSLRIFGQEAINGDNVNYKIVVKNKDTSKEEEYTQDGIIGEYTNISIGKKEEGTYEILVYASSTGYKDAIKEELEVVESYVYFNNVVEHKLTEATVLDKVYSNPVITLYNNSKSDFFNSLWDITSNGGRRIDQIVCSLIATKYINSYFDLDWEYSDKELNSLLNDYEGGVNYSCVGYRLLPYSDVDAEITAKLVHSIDNNIIDAKAKQYFNYLLQEKEYSIKTAAALWGAAKYKEPILLQLYELLDKHDLPLKDRLYLFLALLDLGDYQTAEMYYKDLIEKNIKNEGSYLFVENNLNSTDTNDADNYELTALASVFAVKLKDYENGDKMFKYIYKNPSLYTLSNFEQLIYIMNRDILSTDEVKDLFGELTVTIGDKKQDYKLKLFDRVIFPIKKEDIEKVQFSNIKGDIKCVVEALGNKDDLQKNKSDDFKIDVSYFNKTAQSNTSYKQSDIIKVSIMPSISNYIERGRYEITYILPSGFRYVRSEVDYYNGLYWQTSSDDQKLSYQFSYERHRTVLKPIVFYMQAAQSGEYAVDYVVIKDLYSSKLSFIEKLKLVIE
jgi:hypothetical protein